MYSTDNNNEIILDNPNGIHGYKAFNLDWSCTPGLMYHQNKKQYSCPGIFETSTTPSVGKHGMHFCERIFDIFTYYTADPKFTRIAEVIAWGTVAKHNNICSTNKLEIVRELSWEEIAKNTNLGFDCTGIYNIGSYNAGNWNTGDCNSDNWNTGDCNSGRYNTGNYNTGNCNTGHCNTGNNNTGSYNTGDWNTGDYNNGDRNIGDWNCTNSSSGCFCTEEPEILMFNKPSGMTLRQWRRSSAYFILYSMPKNTPRWINEDIMTEEEKELNPIYKIIGGFFKYPDSNKCVQRWWENLKLSERNIILKLPNFDADIFYKCTGIKVQ